MPDNPPPPSPARGDGIYTIHVNLPSCYLQPAGSVKPKLPDGTFAYDAQEGSWHPPSKDVKRQEFRIQGDKEFVFIAGAQYTYKPNTSLHIKCKKVRFMPHPTDPSQKTVTVRMPGADAEQSLPAQAEKGKPGTTAGLQVEVARAEGPFSSGTWKAVLNPTDGATEGGAGADGATGSQGADAGSLTIEAESYDTSALTDDKVFLIADCTGGKGQQGGGGGDGGGGGNGVDAGGKPVENLVDATGYPFTFRGKWHTYDRNTQGDAEYHQVLYKIIQGFLGAKGGTAGRQGVGGYGGSGGQLTVKLPKESAGDDRLKARFCVQSNAGTPGTAGAAGNPGTGGRCGDSWPLKFPDDKLDDDLRSRLRLDWSSDVVNKWAAYLASGTKPSPINGDAAQALDEQDIQNRREGAGQHKPTTSSNVVFNGSK